MRFIIIIIMLFSSSFLLSQQSRLDALGGLSYSILDNDSQIDPYILGNNPAWLLNSQKSSRLEILPQYKNSNGDYHRLYESDKVQNFDISFMGIKPLGNDGTFRGLASYNYELHNDRNKILTLNPYFGDGYFFTDDTKGDFHYSGPTFELMHSIKIVENLYLGASFGYQIIDGIKKVYTFAESLYRNISGNFGIAYKFSNNISFGINYVISDEQNKITCTDVNKRTVETFLYRGDINRIELRGSTQNYKNKKLGNELNFQTQILPTENLVVGINAEFSNYKSYSLFPTSYVYEDEDGRSNFNITKIVLQTRWSKSESLNYGFTLGYRVQNSWTKNSKIDLTTWKIDVSDKFAGLGFTYSNNSKTILLGAEYELHTISADSLKYIDNRFINITALNHIARIGIEHQLSDIIIIRIGYNFIFKEHDFIFGGEKVTTHLYTIGGKIKLTDTIEIEPRFEYAATNLFSDARSKNNYGIFATLRLYDF